MPSPELIRVEPIERLETEETVVEVIVLWGAESVLHVAHLPPPHAFSVGEGASDATAAPDFVIGRETLGRERLPITLESDGAPALIVPEGATGFVLQGDDCVALADLLQAGALPRCAEVAEAYLCPLPRFASARLEYRGFTFIVRPTPAAARIGMGGPPQIDKWQQRCTLGSVAFHAALLALFYFLPPSSSALAIDRLSADSRLVPFELDANEQDPPPPEWSLNGPDQQQSHADAQRHKGDEGKAGDKNAPKTHGKMGVPGPANNPDPAVPREPSPSDFVNISIIGVLRASQGALNSPTSPYGRDQALGNDPIAAIGALLGDVYAANQGAGGLGMFGVGRGGGGPAAGTLGVGDIGHDMHSRLGNGLGDSAMTSLRTRGTHVPPVIVGKPDIHGSLSKETIRRVIQRHLSEIRYCYEQRLIARPDLQGRVSVKFIIAPTGEVQAAATGSSNLGDVNVEACIVENVRRWTFPAPEGGGVVVVSYPFMLQQAGNN